LTAIQPPLFIGVDGEIGADKLALPYRDIMGEGVVGSGDLAVTQHAAGANMSVDVAAGAAWVKGDDDANAQPTYRVRNDATVTVAVPTADATNPRVDLIVARVYDSAFEGTSLTWDIEVVEGTPTAGATLANGNGKAATPNTAHVLAWVLVPAGASSIVTADIADKRVRATVGGGSASPAAVAPQYVTLTQFAALTATDGLEVYLVVDATNGVVWHLRYNAGSSSAYKWEYLGGAPMIAQGLSGSTTVSTPTSIGGGLVIPRAGDYVFDFGGSLTQPSGDYVDAHADVSNGTVSPSSIDDMRQAGVSGLTFLTLMRRQLLSGVAASSTFNMRIWNSNNTSNVVMSGGWFTAVPRRIS